MVKPPNIVLVEFVTIGCFALSLLIGAALWLAFIG